MLDEVITERVSDLLSSAVRIVATVNRGGYTLARRVIVATRNGSRYFVKAGTDDHTRKAVKTEGRFYRGVQTSWTPELVAFDDDSEYPMIVVEDLSAARWPPPWRADDIIAVENILHQIAEHPPPAWLKRLYDFDYISNSWAAVADAPKEFLSLGLVTPEWLERSLPTLIAASDRTCLIGSALVHFDVHSGNFALLDGRIVLIDWASPRVGSAARDVYGWAASLATEGLQPRADLSDGRYWAILSGSWAAQAGAPPPSGAPHVRPLQRAQLIPALRHAITTLDLEPQTLPKPLAF